MALGRTGMKTVTISMPESMKEFVETEVRTKGYGNVSEYFRELVRDAQTRASEARLQVLLLEGLSSGDDIQVTSEFWKDLRTEALSRLRDKQP
jgi:antitoxin ParD1/3/4